MVCFLRATKEIQRHQLVSHTSVARFNGMHVVRSRCNQTRMFGTNQRSSLPSVRRFSPVHVRGEEGRSSGLCSVHLQPRIQLPPGSHDSLHLSWVGAARHTEDADLQPSRSQTHICQDHPDQRDLWQLGFHWQAGRVVSGSAAPCWISPALRGAYRSAPLSDLIKSATKYAFSFYWPRYTNLPLVIRGHVKGHLTTANQKGLFGFSSWLFWDLV